MSISADCYNETADEKNEENKEILLVYMISFEREEKYEEEKE